MAEYAFDRGAKFSAQTELYDPEGMSPVQLRAFFACGRLRAALDMAMSPAMADSIVNPSCFLLDIDSIVKGPIKFPQEEACFYFTEPCGVNEIENRGTHLLASAFIRPQTMKAYLYEVIKHIKFDAYGYWFVDQVHMHECLPSWRNMASGMNDLNILDVEFKEDTAIWTGRGPRKYTDYTYMAEAARYRDQFFGRN
jgi:hypothetical protein